jgi:uncharacterized protein YbaR (Trm112 family)
MSNGVSSGPGESVTIEPWLLEILACPDCKSPLRLDEAHLELICTGCGLAYPIRDGIPVLLIDEARRPDQPRGKPSKA